MALAPISDPIVAAVADLFHADRWQPSHDDITVQLKRCGLSNADPRAAYAMTGKRKRVRGALLFALDHDPEAGQKLVTNLVVVVRGAGGFRPSSEFFVGDETIENIRAAFATEGFALDDDGTLRPVVLDNLEGTELDQALAAYVRRAKQGVSDAALVTGTGKDLLEAAARRVIHNRGAQYNGHDFPGTLYHAFYAAGLPVPSQAAIDAVNQHLSAAPSERLAECLYFLGCSVNRLRNSQGTGHGRPFPAAVTDTEARAAIEAMGVVSEFLLSAK